MSARRQARVESFADLPSEAGKPPRELFNPDHPVWHDRDRYLAFMARRGWSLPVGDRMGNGTHPANRRNAAAAAWAVENGITAERGGAHADWHRLREMGLIA